MAEAEAEAEAAAAAAAAAERQRAWMKKKDSQVIQLVIFPSSACLTVPGQLGIHRHKHEKREWVLEHTHKNRALRKRGNPSLEDQKYANYTQRPAVCLSTNRPEPDQERWDIHETEHETRHEVRPFAHCLFHTNRG